MLFGIGAFQYVWHGDMRVNVNWFAFLINFKLPLDSSNEIDSHLVTNAIKPEKDVDG